MGKEDKKELSTIQQDSAALSFLEQTGLSLPEPFSRDILLMHTMINGAMHMDHIHELAHGLQAGDRVKLVLEPHNPVDPRAIQVRNGQNQKLGYIPQKKNEVKKEDQMADKGHSEKNIFGGYKHYDEHGRKIGESDPNIFGGYNNYDANGRKIGESDPEFFGGYHNTGNKQGCYIATEITNLIVEIGEYAGSMTTYESLHPNPVLRKENRIRSIHSSLAIEANSLSLNQRQISG